MPVKFEIKELHDLMKNFYILTGIRIVILDESYREIVSYPEGNIPFCAYMRQNPAFETLCQQSDRESFEKCRKTQRLNMYSCHAGLIEASMPIMENGAIIGYIMFGQIANKKDKDSFLQDLSGKCAGYGIPVPKEKIEKIRYKSNQQLVAAANILETCTSYILQKNLIKPSRIQLFNMVDQYITEHMDDNITVESLCETFNISRTRLYTAMKPYVNGGIAAYIRKKRLELAKELLKTTDMGISEICDRVGFSDYNYFLRAFKKQYGLSPKKMKMGL